MPRQDESLKTIGDEGPWKFESEPARPATPHSETKGSLTATGLEPGACRPWQRRLRVLLLRVDERPIMDSPIIRTQTPCENCHRLTAVAVAPSGSFVYLGCSTCGQIWSMRDRRQRDALSIGIQKTALTGHRTTSSRLAVGIATPFTGTMC